MLLWQVDTGKRQDLPHLSSAIDCITISPTGASYAVHLANNSIIALSTSELEPTTYIAGFQSRLISLDPRDRPSIEPDTRRTLEPNNALRAYRKTAVAVNPTLPQQLCLAVPSSQSWTESKDVPVPCNYLQMYDFGLNLDIARQALTRNNATNFNIGPRATRLREPDVRFVQVSANGLWLATVEEWMPPEGDVEYLSVTKASLPTASNLRREVYLKFWSWQKEKKTWALEARIDDPHKSTERNLAGRVFDLVADPTRTSFSTIGSDGFVRVWISRRRTRNGTAVRGSDGELLVTWDCRFAIELERFAQPLDSDDDHGVGRLPAVGCIAYSHDGSLLVASQEFPRSPYLSKVHFIDAATGQMTRTKASLYDAGLLALRIVDRYLVILSNAIHVWDLVSFNLSYAVSLDNEGFLDSHRMNMTHLAVNHLDSTFAVSIPYIDNLSNRIKKHQDALPTCHSEVSVFSVTEANPLSSTRLSQVVTALLPAHGSKGYIILDDAAEIRSITPNHSVPTITSTPDVVNEPDSLVREEDDTFKTASINLEEPEEIDGPLDDLDHAEQEATLNESYVKPVVRPQQLAEVFETAPSQALPPVQNLFYAVANLFSGKTTKVVS